MPECNALYTKEELLTKLRALDEQLDSAETQSELDTGQSNHKFRVSIRQLERQFEKYAALLQRIDPACYRATFGSSVIRFGDTRRDYRRYRCLY